MKKQLLKVSRLSVVTAAFISVAGAAHSQTTIVDSINFSGGTATYTIPCGVTSITIDAYGAQGGSGAAGASVPGGNGGLGGYASGTLTVTPGDVLNVLVGGAGATPTGGFNGGANGGSTNAGGGGGATDIRINGSSEAERILTAGGGGGGGRGGCEGSVGTSGSGGAGGNGGGDAGVNGGDSPTSGGVAGGGKGGNFGAVAGASGPAGVGCGGFLGTPGGTSTTGTGAAGGAGQSCCCFSNVSIPGGGGGGGGQIGGGGGGGGSAGTTGCSGNDKGAGGGGGGGTSYNGGMTTAGTITNGVRTGNGVVIISYEDPTPVASLSTTVNPICEGDTVTFVAASTNSPSSYTWAATGGVTILSGQGTNTITVSGATTGDLTVFATTACGDGPTTSPFTITVNPLPNVTIAASLTEVCAGETITLSGNGANAGYTWDNGVTDGVAFVPSNTTYTVTGIDSNGCSNVASQAITVNQLPTVGLTAAQANPVCGGQNIALTGTPAGGTYSELAGSPTALTGSTFNAPTQGTWDIEYAFTDANGCSGADTISIVVNCMVGLEMIGSEGTMNVYPNPTNGNFTISSKGNINGSVQLFNELGQLVYEQAVTGVNKKQVEIKNLTPGTYQLKITSEGQVFSGKLNVTK